MLLRRDYMTLPKYAIFFEDRGTTARGGQRGACETDQVSLLSAQSAYLPAAGVRGPASVQRRLCQIKLYSTAVRLSGTIP